jgi:hypothetical protein
MTDPGKKPGGDVLRLGGQQALLHHDAGRAQPGDALAVDPRIAITRGDHHAADAGRDQRVRAGRRAAPVAARLQRHVHGGAA